MKTVLQSYGLTPDVEDPVLRQALRIIWPLDEVLAARVRSESVSLTDSATSSEQIRFFQGQRALRSYVKIARWVCEQHRDVRIHIDRADLLDEPSREFLRVAAAVGRWEVRLCLGCDESVGAARVTEHVPKGREARLLHQLERLPEQPTEVWAAAFDYVNAGDAWTAIGIGRQLLAVEQSPRVWNLLALAHAMLGQSESAEFYYRRWAADGGPIDEIRASYGIAMLYARHHRVGLRDLEKAADHLDRAFALIVELPSSDQDDPAIVFESVFNRNGRALILFRQGEVDRALALLESGIERLTHTTEKVAIHRSVLMYNLAQCHRQLGDLDAAIRAYEQLLAVDPFMPEYHLEAARCLAAAGRPAAAVAAVEDALELDDTLPVAWGLLGLYRGELDEYGGAAEAYAEAATLDPDRQSYPLDRSYYLILAGDSEAALSQLSTFEPLGAANHERHATLMAEALNRIGRRGHALAVLEQAMLEQPDSTVLRTNRATLATARTGPDSGRSSWSSRSCSPRACGCRRWRSPCTLPTEGPWWPSGRVTRRWPSLADSPLRSVRSLTASVG
ncbi:hypothetical protein BIU98_07345 [Curtobacterium sp. MMLR14_010]|nr:hypothetical protein BIU98_07345 [Curtobacterium sp. MMLR14_010]